MEFQPDEFNNILNIFQQESNEIISSMDDKLLILEKDGANKDLLIRLFRDAHSLKGSARMLGFNDIQTLAHKIEDAINLIKEEKIKINSELTDTISECLAFISTLINKTVVQKTEFKSPDINLYLQKLNNVINNNKLDIPYVDINTIINPEQKNAILIYNPISNLATEILYFLSLMRMKNDFHYISSLEEKTIEFINTIQDINYSNFNLIKTQIYNLEQEIIKFKSSDNKNLNFLELNNSTTKLIEYLQDFSKIEHIKEKDFYEIVEKKLNNFKTNIEEFKPINNKNNSQNLEELTKKMPLLGLNSTFYDNTINLINNLIKEETNQNIKQILTDLNEIILSFKNSEIVMYDDLAADLKEILTSIKSSDKKLIDEAKLKINIIKTMVKFQNKGQIRKKPDRKKLEQNQKEIFNSITNTEIKTLRVDSFKLDNLVGQIGELIVSKIKTNEQLSLAKKINNDLIDWQKNFSKMSYYIKYFDKKYLSNPNDNIEQNYKKIIAHNRQLCALAEQHNNKITDLIKEASSLFKQLQESENKLNSTTSEIEEMVKNMRILPLSTIFQLFPRMVHNIAKEKNKKIDLIIEGSDITADKTIIEELKIPLMHIIRNSIDHGIEDTQTRKLMGKNPVGKICIRATNTDSKIVVEVKDDGRGLDIDKIKQKALEKKLLTKEEINTISDEEITNLIFYPGFSTEEFVTELSGRGLGLDIVNNKINHLQGRIDIFSTLNMGTTVRIILPATVATKKVFVIEEEKQLWAIETSVIKTIVRINFDEIYEKDNKNYFIYDNNPIVVYTLSQILNFKNKQRETNKYTLMIIETENATFGIIVDKLISDQEIVHKKLAPPLYKVKHISGITTLANGETCLILSVSDIITTVNSKKINTKIISKNELSKTKNNFKYKILLLDDSHTTRMLQKNILTNEGYNVTTVTNPINALEKLKLNNFDLIITDINMPKMSGFDFTKEVRSIAKYENIPIYVISGEEKESHKEEIIENKITAYIEKKDYKQNEFLKSIEEILNY